MQSKIKKAIFPIAGLGSRFLPATKILAKEMLEILKLIMFLSVLSLLLI